MAVVTVLLANAQTPARLPVKVACIGDSITYGFGIDDRDANSYPAVLQSLLGQCYDVRNFGNSARVMSGTGDLPYMNEPMYADVKAFLPDVVLIMLGTNDTKPYNWNAEQFEKDCKLMVKEMKSLDSHPDIFLCYPPTVARDQWGINEKGVVQDVMPIIDRVAAGAWLDVIDTHSPTQNMPWNYLEDGVHPNAEGAAVIARTVAQALRANGYGETPGKRVLFIGDSVTDGEWGGGKARPSAERNHYDYNHVLGHGFPEMCAARCLADFPQGEMRFYNRGISGNTLPTLAQRWDSDVLAVHPDIVSVLVGINDTGHKTDADFDYQAWEQLYRSLLDRTLAAIPGVSFVLCSPFVSDKSLYGGGEDYSRRRPIVEKLAATVRRIAEDYGAVYVDTFGLVDNLVASAGQNGQPASSDHKYWMWDGIHPTTACHQKIADLWLSACRGAGIIEN